MLVKGIHDTFQASLLQTYKANKYGREKTHNLQKCLKMEA